MAPLIYTYGVILTPSYMLPPSVSLLAIDGLLGYFRGCILVALVPMVSNRTCHKVGSRILNTALGCTAQLTVRFRMG